ncbi:MAG TPA: hypothetical protein PLD87_10880 [Bacteroidia bacterium]|nr:hypothetical protein [Bacteroidia bacterium]
MKLLLKIIHLLLPAATCQLPTAAASCLLLTALCLLQPAYAQHCPYCGSYVVVIKTPKKLTKQLQTGAAGLSLQETEYPQQLCKYAEHQITKPFVTAREALINTWDTLSYAYTEANENLENSALLSEGHYAVMLNSAQYSCMIPQEGNNYHYKKRNYRVIYMRKNKLTALQNVSPEKIYSLCSEAGNWNRIKPLEIEMKK